MWVFLKLAKRGLVITMARGCCSKSPSFRVCPFVFYVRDCSVSNRPVFEELGVAAIPPFSQSKWCLLAQPGPFLFVSFFQGICDIAPRRAFDCRMVNAVR